MLESEKTPINRVSLFFSLAKLNYDDDLLRDGYFEKAKALLSEIEERTNSYYELDRRIRFLELRLSFFSGKKVNDLMRLSEEILKSDEGFSIINNNTLFYYILLHIVDGKIETAEKMLEENHLFFKGTGVIMEDFLNAVLFEHKGDHKRSIKLLNPILYTTQYFFTIFSRLVLIKIHLKRDNRTLCKSLIDSTAKLLVQNSGNPLGKEANEYVLSSFRRRIGSVRNTKNKGIEVENEVQLSVFHEYLLKD